MPLSLITCIGIGMSINIFINDLIFVDDYELLVARDHVALLDFEHHSGASSEERRGSDEFGSSAFREEDEFQDNAKKQEQTFEQRSHSKYFEERIERC